MPTFFTKSEKDRERLLAWARAVDLDKPLMISVAEGSKRSIQQNKLFHMWVAIIAGETGYSKRDIKEYVKREFLTPKIHKFRGQIIESYETRDLKVNEFTDFLKAISAFADENGWYLPHPEDQHERTG